MWLTDTDQKKLIEELYSTTAKLKGGVRAIFEKYGVVNVPPEVLAEVAAATKQAEKERRRNPRPDGLEKSLNDLSMSVRRIIERNTSVDTQRTEREGVVKRGVIQILTGIGWIKK